MELARKEEDLIARTFYPGEWSRRSLKGSIGFRHEFLKARDLEGYQDPAFGYRGGNFGNRPDLLNPGQRERQGSLMVALVVVQACRQSGLLPLSAGVVVSLGNAGLGVKREG